MKQQEQGPTSTRQAIYDLARWRIGAAETSLISETWPDLPKDREGYSTWVKSYPDVAERVAKIDPEGPPPDAPPLTLWSADQILTADWPEPVWAIPGLLPRGLTILAGKPKLGKSWLALQIAQSVASGGWALGRQVEQGPVLYLALEDPARRLQDRMKQQNWPTGLDADFMVIDQFADQIGDLRYEGGEKLALQIEARGYRLVIVDTLLRAVYGDPNDAEKMTRALAPLQAMSHKLNSAVTLVDHHKKGFGADPNAVGDILGSTAKGATPDCLWGLYRDYGKSDAKLYVIGRDVPETQLSLKFDGLTGCWQAEIASDQLNLTDKRQTILDAVIALENAKVAEIADAAGIDNRGSVYKELSELIKAGHVVKTGEGWGNVHYSPTEK